MTPSPAAALAEGSSSVAAPDGKRFAFVATPLGFASAAERKARYGVSVKVRS